MLPRGVATRAGAAPGITLAGTTAGAWGAATGLGQAGADNARVEARGLSPPVGRSFQGSRAPATSQEAWPGVAPNGLTPCGSEPWRNADRRARFAKRALHRARCGGWNTRLSAFRFPLFFVVARVERSEPRELNASFTIVPGFRSRSIRATVAKLGRSRAARTFWYVRGDGEASGCVRRQRRPHVLMAPRWRSEHMTIQG